MAKILADISDRNTGLQAIVTRYVGPSNTRGAYISVKASAGTRRFPYPHQLSGMAVHQAAAEWFAKSFDWLDGWALVGGGMPQSSKDDYCFVLVRVAKPEQATEHKQMIQRLIDCAELCQEELEPETDALIGEASALIARKEG